MHQGLVWRWLDTGRHFLVWLFVDIPLGIYHLWQQTALSFEGQLAVVVTTKNITRPLFQDYTREGRLIGFLMRLFRIVLGLVVQALLVVTFFLLLVVWMALPFYLVWQILHNILGIILY